MPFSKWDTIYLNETLMPFSKWDTIYLNESKRYRDALDLSKTLYFRNGQITLTGVCLIKKLKFEGVIRERRVKE